MSVLAPALSLRRRAVSRSGPGHPPLLVLIAALIVAAVALVPPVYLAVRISDAPAVAARTVFARSTLDLTVRTFAFAAAVTALATAIALPLAWLTERTDLPARRLIAILAAAPLAVPTYVGAMVAISTFGPGGLVHDLFGHDLPVSIYGAGGATVVLALFTYPYLLLTLRPVVAALDPRLEEASRGFGHGRWATFRSVVLPQLRPALSSGGLIVALYALSDFGAPSLMRFNSFTRVIFIRYQSTFDRTGAAALAAVLALLALALVSLEVRARGRRRYDAVRASGARSAPPIQLGRWRWPALAFVGLILGLALVLPASVLGYWLIRGFSGGEALRGIADATRDTLLGAGLAATITAAAAFPIAFLAVRHPRFPLTRPIEVLAYSGYALPGLVVALALVFASLNLGPLYQSLAILVLAYLLLFAPLAIGATRVALLQVRPSVEEAARGLGRSRWNVIRTVTAPLAGRGILAGAALVFLTTIKELPATLLLAPIGFDTLAVRVWSASSEAFFARAALPALMLLLLSSLPLALLEINGRRR
ncbi:MAG: iron ABC transporter permease [Chloroflexi bacterium]|nr:iron ABC transporter permease [Chloroflexota bacterium]